MKRVTYKPFLNKKKLNRDGESLIMICAYQSGKRKYFSTGEHIKPNKWNEKKIDPLIGRKIRDKISDLERFEDEFFLANRKFSLSDFDHYKNPEETTIIRPESFLVFFESELKNAKPRLSDQTYRQHNVTLKYFKEFGGEKYRWNLTIDMVQKWDTFLRSKPKIKSQNTLSKRHIQLRKYISIAQSKEYVDKNPYDNKVFKIESAKTNPTYLTVFEREKLESLVFTEDEKLIEMARDMYLIGCYTSLRISDVFELRKENFSEVPEGLRITINVAKGQQRENKKWEYLLDDFYNGKATALVKKYWRADNRRFFKSMSKGELCKLLKVIAKMAQINKHITFHSSRHTFGSHAVLIMPLIDVKKIMQHSNIAMTETYLHLNNTEHKERLKKIKWE